jgi:hypothetical protein
MAVFLVVAGLVGPVVFGFLMRTLGWGVCITLFVASIMMMTKGAPVRGAVAFLFAVIILPVWIMVAPGAIAEANEDLAQRRASREQQKQQEAAQSAVSPLAMTEASGGMSPTPATVASEPVVDALETITSRDGRMIRGKILMYDAWGVQVRREDGLVVNVKFDLMSAKDMQRFRDRYNSLGR